MFMGKQLNDFLQDESGAVTVDWVVLTAAVVGLSIAVFATLGNGAHHHAEQIGDKMASESIKTAY